MQPENIKKIILVGALCATVGFITYNMQYKDNGQQVRSQIGPNIESIKKMHIQKGIQKNLESKKPSMGKPSKGKPSMGKPSMGKPSMGKPSMGKPSMGKPSMGKPSMGKPSMGKPSMGKPSKGRQFQSKIALNNISGIGAMIIELGDFTYIHQILPNSPADNAGLKSGDKIISINNKNTNEISFREIINSIRGENGTTVSLEVERQNGDTVALNIERAKLIRQNKIFS